MELEEQIIRNDADKGQRVTKALLESKVKSVYYINGKSGVQASFVVPTALPEEDLIELGLVTFCIIILENGFKVDGVSACVDPANYNEQIGRECAYEEAFNKLWQLEGYLLKQGLFDKAQSQEMLKGFLEDDNCEGGGCKI